MTNEFDPIAEIEELHTFFEAWFTGESDRTTGIDRLETVLHEEFQMIIPDGDRRHRDAVIDGIKNGYGTNKTDEPSFSIDIRSPVIRHRSESTALLTYEEWQQSQAGETGRLSSVWFHASPGTPNGCQWYHLHETWLEH